MVCRDGHGSKKSGLVLGGPYALPSSIPSFFWLRLAAAGGKGAETVLERFPHLSSYCYWEKGGWGWCGRVKWLPGIK